ncbi:hypothetical protein [Amycolatopsis thermophila]|uniref:Excreted virulence factor EspC, type VII ESX diderm n=1 Tax=Amycolatopsis thermophila TaxID=206084 RepID=A0ABU0ELP5_9PSEU|nr:hypothetical protein [Amycolatopsis thermophila]MDQ0376142.1 hypothetical protein [Amycolatopsis thermophila]
MSFLEISTSVEEIRSMGEQIARLGTDLQNLASGAAGQHGEAVGGDTELSKFGDDDLGKQFKPTYRDLDDGGAAPSQNGGKFSPTKAGQLFQSMNALGEELSKLGDSVRKAIDEQMGAELDNIALLNKTDRYA